MSQPQKSITVMTSERAVRLTNVRAVQDRDCLDLAKFRYDLDFPLPQFFFEQFADAKVTVREFSKLVPLGKDLFSIVRPGFFRADGLVQGNKITVAFHGDPENWPLSIMRDFERRLNAVGYGDVHYEFGAEPKCAECPSRFEKKCGAFHGIEF